MREDRRKRYDDGFRHEALGLIKAGAGKHFLARRLAMPVQTAEKWIMKYRSNGEDAVMGAKCLCSMVLRPVERLVFSPKER